MPDPKPPSRDRGLRIKRAARNLAFITLALRASGEVITTQHNPNNTASKSGITKPYHDSTQTVDRGERNPPDSVISSIPPKVAKASSGTMPRSNPPALNTIYRTRNGDTNTQALQDARLNSAGQYYGNPQVVGKIQKTGAGPEPNTQQTADSPIAQIGNSILNYATHGVQTFVDAVAATNFLMLGGCADQRNFTTPTPSAERTRLPQATPTIVFEQNLSDIAFAQQLSRPTAEFAANNQDVMKRQTEFVRSLESALQLQFHLSPGMFRADVVLPDKTKFLADYDAGHAPKFIVAKLDDSGKEIMTYAPILDGLTIKGFVAIPKGGQWIKSADNKIGSQPSVVVSLGSGKEAVYDFDTGAYIDIELLSAEGVVQFQSLFESRKTDIRSFVEAELTRLDSDRTNPSVVTAIIPIFDQNGNLLIAVKTITEGHKNDSPPDLPGYLPIKNKEDGSIEYYIAGKGANTGEFYPSGKIFDPKTNSIIDIKAVPTIVADPIITSTPSATPTLSPSPTAAPTKDANTGIMEAAKKLNVADPKIVVIPNSPNRLVISGDKMWVVVNKGAETSLVEVTSPPVAADKLVWDSNSNQFSSGKMWLDMDSKQWLSAKGVHINLMEGYTQAQRMAEVAKWKQSVQFTGWEGKFVTVNGQQIPAKDFILQAVEKYAGAIQPHHDLPEFAKDVDSFFTNDPLTFLLLVRKITYDPNNLAGSSFLLRGGGYISLNVDNIAKGYNDDAKAPLTVLTIIKEGMVVGFNLKTTQDPCNNRDTNIAAERSSSLANIFIPIDIAAAHPEVKTAVDRWRVYYETEYYPHNSFFGCK